MKTYIKRGCIDSNRNAYEAGTVVDINKSTDKKLWDLKLVEDYDVKEHGKAPEASGVALKKANKALDEANKQITELQSKLDGAGDTAALDARIVELTGFVEEAIGLAKGTVPDGYIKAE